MGLRPHDFESCVSASSTTSAFKNNQISGIEAQSQMEYTEKV